MRIDNRKSSGGAAQHQRTEKLIGNIFQLVKAGDTPWLARLLQIGLTPNLHDNEGNTLLALACRYGHYEAVRVLLEFGADPEIANHRGQTPLDLATQGQRADIAELLADYHRQVTQKTSVA